MIVYLAMGFSVRLKDIGKLDLITVLKSWLDWSLSAFMVKRAHSPKDICKSMMRKRREWHLPIRQTS